MGNRATHSGFTLVELMIVMAIISILLVIAVSSYHRYFRYAVRGETSSMLAEIRLKEEAYMAENGYYVSTTATRDPASAQGGSEADVEPPLLGASEFQLKNAVFAGPGWADVGVVAIRNQLYCSYVAISGIASPGAPTPITDLAAAGQDILSAEAASHGGNLTRSWFYARACCDFKGDLLSQTNCPGSDTWYEEHAVSFSDNILRVANEGQ
jgi:prepilin-type N-terminal cleavage/methylation domain-containing protein